MAAEKEKRCQFWLPNKRRLCANSPLPHSLFCGNHDPSAGDLRVPCPLDPSHSIARDNLESHLKRCPLKKQSQALQEQPYYSKGINFHHHPEPNVTSQAKRSAVYTLTATQFHNLVTKIIQIHSSISPSCFAPDSFCVSDVCRKWLQRQQLERQMPYQEKHAMQQASILGNMESFGILRKPDEESANEGCGEGVGAEDLDGKGDVPAVVEFGAGRGYLTQMLADCYGIRKVFLVERRSYKFKADRSLRQHQNLILERLRIDIEDLNLYALESLRGLPYLAIGKHLCGPAIDLTIRCCFPEQCNESSRILTSSCYLQGLALATCCHHLCQWKHYINKDFFTKLGIGKDDFHAVTWFSSWAVDADHSSDLADSVNQGIKLSTSVSEESNLGDTGIEAAIRNMPAVERAMLGFMCKEIIDTGRLLWLKEHRLEAGLIKYVPLSVSPENHLLVANCRHRL